MSIVHTWKIENYSHLFCVHAIEAIRRYFFDRIRWVREHWHTKKARTHTHVKMPNGCVMESLHYHLQCNILVSFPHHQRPIDEKFVFFICDMTSRTHCFSHQHTHAAVPFRSIWFDSHTFAPCRRWSWGIVRDIWYCNLHVGSHRCFIAPSHVPFQSALSHSLPLAVSMPKTWQRRRWKAFCARCVNGVSFVAMNLNESANGFARKHILLPSIFAHAVTFFL